MTTHQDVRRGADAEDYDDNESYQSYYSSDPYGSEVLSYHDEEDEGEMFQINADMPQR